jgi:hypothetical protein
MCIAETSSDDGTFGKVCIYDRHSDTRVEIKGRHRRQMKTRKQRK